MKKDNKDAQDNVHIKKLTAADIIEQNIEKIFNLISNNISYSAIAKQLGISKPSLVAVLNSDDLRARKAIALECAADIRIKKAEKYLLDIKADDTHATVKKLTHLYAHEVYIAKIKCPQKYDLNYHKKDAGENSLGNIIVLPNGQSVELLHNLSNKDDKDNKDNKFIGNNTNNNE